MSADQRPVSLQMCGTRITIRTYTGGPDIVGYCTMHLGHEGAHYVRTS